jgi:class 3 adenylate cyclase
MTSLATLRDASHDAAMRGDTAILCSIAEELLLLPEPLARALALDNIALAKELNGDFPAALEQFLLAKELYHSLGDNAGVARTTGRIGNVYSAMGSFPEALRQFHAAYDLFVTMGDPYGQAVAISNMGIVNANIGSYNEALDQFMEALRLHELHDNRQSAVSVMGSIGDVYLDTNKPSDALAMLERAYQESLALDMRFAAGYILGSIVAAHLAIGNFDDATDTLAAQSSYLALHPIIVINHHIHHSSLMTHQGRLQEANDMLHVALTQASNSGIRAEQARIHNLLRDNAQARNSFADYILHNTEFNRINEEIRGKDATQKLAVLDIERKVENELRERDKERTLLYGTLPKAVADRIIRGEVVNDSFENAALLFMDIVGFTVLSSTMSSHNLVQLLGQLFSACDEIVAANNMLKIKTIGDSYMAAAFDDDVATNAARTALQLLAALRHRFPDLTVRIGLHCGPVTAGVIGTERMQYDVWGDTVNVASRMESHGEPGRVHISASVAAQLSINDFTLTPRGPITVKGKGQMETYWLDIR